MQKFKQGLELWGLQVRQGGESGYLGIFTHSNTANRTYTLPNKSGTLATLDDIASGSYAALNGSSTQAFSGSTITAATQFSGPGTGLTGTAASLTAGLATKLATARTISLTGDTTGSVSFDGSANVSIATSIADSVITGGLLTGYAVGSNAALAATDTILSSLGKIQAQLNAKQASGSYLTGITSAQVITALGYTPVNDSGDTITGNLCLTGSLITTANQSGLYKFRDLAFYTADVASSVGTVKITLPKTWTSTMMRITIDGYDYSGNSPWQVIVSGYAYADGSSWVNATCQISGNAPFSSVRLAHDGTYCCILLGTTSTTLAYPKITISEVMLGYSNFGTSWANGWSISRLTSESGLVNIAAVTTYVNINSANIGSQSVNYASSAGSVAWDGITSKPFLDLGVITVNPVASSNATCTTAQFVQWLKDRGILNYRYSVGKCSWYYAGNNDISDVMGRSLELAGCVIETFSDGSCYTIRVTSPTTGNNAGQEWIYNDQGPGYSPGWRKVLNSNTPLKDTLRFYYEAAITTAVSMPAYRIDTAGQIIGVRCYRNVAANEGSTTISIRKNGTEIYSVVAGSGDNLAWKVISTSATAVAVGDTITAVVVTAGGASNLTIQLELTQTV